jgi:drug/metabolite transporter (DMT)-like permease
VAGLPRSDGSRRPGALLLGAVLAFILLLWCFNYVAGKIALRHLDPLSLVSLRIEFAAAVSLAILCMRPRRKRFRRADLWSFAYLGLFGVVMNQGCFTTGLNYTTSERSVVLVAITPIVVLVLARLMGLEAITPAKALGLTIASVGVWLLESERGSMAHVPFAVGDFITFLGIVGFSVFSVLGKRLLDPQGKQPDSYDAFSFNTFTLAAAAVELLPLAVRQSLRLSWTAVGWQGWGGLIYMALFSSVIAYTLFYWVLRYMDASRVAAIDYFQPFVVIALSLMFLGERPTGHLLSAGVLVLGGVYLAERNPTRRERTAAATP